MKGSSDEGRVRDGRAQSNEFAGEYLVACPRCTGCAKHVPIERAGAHPRAARMRRLTCTNCGYAQDWPIHGFSGASRDKPVDDYFGLPLWLQDRWFGHALWAFNARHLTFMESYVRAVLRASEPDLAWNWSNRGLREWLRTEQDRDEILHAITRMRMRLPNATTAGDVQASSG